MEPQGVDLAAYSRSRNLTPAKLLVLANRLNLEGVELGSKKMMIATINEKIVAQGIAARGVIDALAYAVYWDAIEGHIQNLPAKLRDQLIESGLVQSD